MRNKTILLLFLAAFLLTSCGEKAPTNEDYNSVNQSLSSTGQTSDQFDSADISSDKSNEATEDQTDVSTGETATNTSFSISGASLSGTTN